MKQCLLNKVQQSLLGKVQPWVAANIERAMNLFSKTDHRTLGSMNLEDERLDTGLSLEQIVIHDLPSVISSFEYLPAASIIYTTCKHAKQ